MKGKFSILAKFIGLFLLFVIIVFITAHFAIQYGVQAGEIQQFLAKTWFFWLIVRFIIYGCGGYFLRQLIKFAHNEEDVLAYKKLARAAMIGLIAIESVIIVQVLRG